MAPPSAPCSPRTAAGDHHHLLPGYCYFFSSAPTSPSRTSCYAPAADDDSASAAAFDFAIGFSGQLRDSAQPTLAAADELFEGGRIRPLNPTATFPADDDRRRRPSPRSPRRSKPEPPAPETRGRSARPGPAAATSRRTTRSLSPFRGAPAMDDEEDELSSSSPPSRGASLMRGCGSGSSRKWRLKDLFLFRSASEGRATGNGKDPLLKYTMLKATGGGHGGGGDSGSASMRIKGRGSAASASDMAPYYAVAAEETRRRRTSTTPLPFHRNSLFGYLRSNPAIHTISRKLGGSNRGRPAAAAAAANA